MYENLIGTAVNGYEKKRINDLAYDKRLCVTLLLDTSASISNFRETLESSVKHLIKVLSNDSAADHIDLEIITFNGIDQIQVVLNFTELSDMIENGTLKREFDDKISFPCKGGTPTGYAVRVAVDTIKEHHEALKNAAKSPLTPVLFIFSDGAPMVARTLEREHNEVLKNAIDEIRTELVPYNKLTVFGIEVGEVNTYRNYSAQTPQKNAFEAMNTTMISLTGLPDERHICTADNIDSLEQTFKITETLIKSSVNKNAVLNNVSVSDVELR